jgi:hypothetical protein
MSSAYGRVNVGVIPGIPLADPVSETHLDGWEQDVLLGGRMSASPAVVVYNTISTFRHMRSCEVDFEDTTPPTAGALKIRAQLEDDSLGYCGVAM